MRTSKTWLMGLVALFPAVAMAVGVESVVLRVDDGGKPGEEIETFIPTDLVQHFDIRLDEIMLGDHKFVVEFWAVDTSAGQNIKVTEFTGGSLVANTINAKVSLPREWPVGLYRLDVKADGELLGSYEYDVAEPEE